jgi:hypothetical protein
VYVCVALSFLEHVSVRVDTCVVFALGFPFKAIPLWARHLRQAFQFSPRSLFYSFIKSLHLFIEAMSQSLVSLEGGASGGN